MSGYAGLSMKIGDIVKHKLFPVYGIGVVIEVIPVTNHVARVYFSKFKNGFLIMTKHLKVISESR